MHLPFAKLGFLTIKTLAKPVSKRIKSQAAQHPLGAKFCAWVGQHTHYLTTRINIAATGHVALKVPPLNEERALKRGAEFLGETFIYGVGGAIVVYEYLKSEEKNRVKAEQAKKKRREELEAINQQIEFVREQVSKIEEYLHESTHKKAIWKPKMYQKSAQSPPEFKPLSEISSSFHTLDKSLKQVEDVVDSFKDDAKQLVAKEMESSNSSLKKEMP
mmetsp:Transcript_20014/g.26422  ORF Transcript_20014/g.26422 Transcript_20014/m.26422 type:complete len:217 (-) Transcript_20014:89-739(-)